MGESYKLKLLYIYIKLAKIVLYFLGRPSWEYNEMLHRETKLCARELSRNRVCRLDVNLTVNIRGFDRYDVLVNWWLISFYHISHSQRI